MQMVDCISVEKENGRGFSSARYPPIRSVRYLAATHTVSSPQARHKVNARRASEGSQGITVLRNSIACCYGWHLRIYLYEYALSDILSTL